MKTAYLAKQPLVPDGWQLANGDHNISKPQLYGYVHERQKPWLRRHWPAILATIAFGALLIISFLILKHHAPQFVHSLDLK